MLTQEQIIQFHTKGYIGPFDALNPQELLEYKDFFMKNVAEPAQGNSDFYTNLHVVFQSILKTASHKNIITKINQILGPDVMVWKTTFIAKKAFCEKDLVEWHQDSFYRRVSLNTTASIWLALTKMTVQNGCLKSIPGSHWFDLPHVKSESAMFPDKLDEKFFNPNAPHENFECEAGQFFIFNEKVIHKSDANNTPDLRLAMICRYSTPSSFILSPPPACVLISGTDNFKLNKFFDPNKIKY